MKTTIFYKGKALLFLCPWPTFKDQLKLFRELFLIKATFLKGLSGAFIYLGNSFMLMVVLFHLLAINTLDFSMNPFYLLPRALFQNQNPLQKPHDNPSLIKTNPRHTPTPTKLLSNLFIIYIYLYLL